MFTKLAFTAYSSPYVRMFDSNASSNDYSPVQSADLPRTSSVLESG